MKISFTASPFLRVRASIFKLVLCHSNFAGCKHSPRPCIWCVWCVCLYPL